MNPSRHAATKKDQYQISEDYTAALCTKSRELGAHSDGQKTTIINRQ